jgi:golgi to ER traffic protein 4
LRFTEDETYDAERHLILGTKDSPEVLARMEYDWYSEDEVETAPFYVARAVIPYLLTGNLRAANKSFLLFTSRLPSASPSPVMQEVSSSLSELRVYPTLPLLNFFGLLLLTVQRGEASLFRMLKTHYAANLKDLNGAWDEALAQIGEMYFGIKIPSQTNPLFDMMGSMLMGGMKGGKKGKTKGPDSPKPPAID